MDSWFYLLVRTKGHLWKLSDVETQGEQESFWVGNRTARLKVMRRAE